MSDIQWEYWLFLNQNGLFPAPHQSMADLLRKIEWLKFDGLILSDRLQTTALDLNPNWVTYRVENKGLHFWEGAALWQQEIAPGIHIPTIQIPTHSRIDKEELIAHEMIHASRVDFCEPQFEEMLAYTSSSRAWRRYLGPFFRKPIESFLFMGLIGAILAIQYFNILWEGHLSPSLFPGFLLSLLGLGWVRLHLTHRIFERCLSHLRAALPHPNKALALMIRLTDAEIKQFATLSPDQIASFIAIQDSFRWQILSRAYGFPK